LWRQLLGDATADRYIVLEDDVIVDWSFIEKLHYVHDSEIGADFLRLFFMSVAPTRTLKAQLFGTYYIVELFGYAFGSQAYIITKAAAERFVLNLQRVVRPIDLAMESAWSHGVPNLAVFPFPVIHVSGESSMEPQRWVSEPKPFGLKFRPKRLRQARTPISGVGRSGWAAPDRLDLKSTRTGRWPSGSDRENLVCGLK
jgi:glycosyl transferase family 25